MSFYQNAFLIIVVSGLAGFLQATGHGHLSNIVLIGVSLFLLWQVVKKDSIYTIEISFILATLIVQIIQDYKTTNILNKTALEKYLEAYSKNCRLKDVFNPKKTNIVYMTNFFINKAFQREDFFEYVTYVKSTQELIVGMPKE